MPVFGIEDGELILGIIVSVMPLSPESELTFVLG